jgi:hypothetical protein
VGRSWKVMLLDFRHHFWSGVTYWIVHAHLKSQVWDARTKIQLYRLEIRKNAIEKIQLITSEPFWQNIKNDELPCCRDYCDYCLFRSDRLLGPRNDFCSPPCRHFGAWIEISKRGLTARCDPIKMIFLGSCKIYNISYDAYPRAAFWSGPRKWAT